MATSQLLLAGTTTTGWWNATLDRRVELSDATGTVQGLDRDKFTWLAESNVTEVWALVQSTGELLVALDHAKMATIGVRTVPNGATDLLAVVLLALFELVADAFALKIIDFIDFLFRHQLLPLL